MGSSWPPTPTSSCTTTRQSWTWPGRSCTSDSSPAGPGASALNPHCQPEQSAYFLPRPPRGWRCACGGRVQARCSSRSTYFSYICRVRGVKMGGLPYWGGCPPFSSKQKDSPLSSSVIRQIFTVRAVFQKREKGLRASCRENLIKSLDDEVNVALGSSEYWSNYASTHSYVQIHRCVRSRPRPRPGCRPSLRAGGLRRHAGGPPPGAT